MIVTYGGHGGSKCAAQLRQVLEDGLKMKPLSTMPAFSLSRARIEADTGEIAAAEELAGHEPALHEAFAELVYALGHRNSMELP